MDASGNAYITGVTVPGIFRVQTARSALEMRGAEDAFVAKLDSSGRLLYSTYIGGEGSDFGFSIAVDGGGFAYVAGQTNFQHISSDD